jgi:hypothetical protein
MQKYEYDIQLQYYAPKLGDGIRQDIHTLNLRGYEGWELVSVCGPIESGEAHGVAWYYFFVSGGMRVGESWRFEIPFSSAAFSSAPSL